jgi:hypothetical protein
MPAPRPRRTGGGITFGVVLVFVGAVLLAAQFVPGVPLWALWPLIIIVAGGVQAVTPGEEGTWNVSRFFDGLVTVAFGIVLLGNTMGYLPWAIWWRIVMLWPVLLISAGIGIIGRAVHQRWLGAAGSALVIAALAWAAVGNYQAAPLPVLQLGTAAKAETLSKSEAVGSVHRASVTLDTGAATVKVADGYDLFKVDASSPWGTPTAAVSRSGSSAAIKIGLEQGRPIAWPTSQDSSVDLKLARDVDWDVVVNSGATSMDLDLRRLSVSSLRLNTGASEATVRLGEPAGGSSRIEFSSGASSFDITVPRGVQARVRFETALVDRTMGGFNRSNAGVYETPEFSASRPYWDIVVKSAVGDINFTRE